METTVNHQKYLRLTAVAAGICTSAYDNTANISPFLVERELHRRAGLFLPLLC